MRKIAFRDDAAYLRERLGPELVAYLAGSDEREAPSSWARGQSPPDEHTVARLRCAYEATQVLLAAYGDSTARSWFVGANPLLNDEAPASVLRRGETPEDWRLIVPAARHFTEDAFPPR